MNSQADRQFKCSCLCQTPHQNSIMKFWKIINFVQKESGATIMYRISVFANRYGLTPDEFKIGPTDKDGTVTVMFYTDKELPECESEI